MVELAFATLFVAWLWKDSGVLAPVREPILGVVESASMAPNRVMAAMAGYLYEGLTCRVCVGFWISLAINAWALHLDWSEVAAANGLHVLLVTAEATAKWGINSMKAQQRAGQGKTPA